MPVDEVWNPEQTAHHPDDFHETLSQAWDDITGAELEVRVVRKARMTELGYAEDKKVLIKIPRSTSVRNGWKIIESKWIDINKGGGQESGIQKSVRREGIQYWRH